jgi:CRP/FNR family cyclic AMP-dependent transcriptional regulator
MRSFRGDSDQLKDLPPFSWLTEAQLEWALPTVQHRSYAARSIVLRAGAPADGLYILLSGRAQLVYEKSNGRQFIASVVRAHDFFGEVGLFEGGDSVASVLATEPCEILYIPRAVVIECLKSNSDAAMCMLSKVIKRLGASQRKLAQFALADVYERVGRVLLEHTPEQEGEVAVEIGSEQIAGLVGSSREMVSRVLKSMMQQGIARRRGRKLMVLDRQALRLITSATF